MSPLGRVLSVGAALAVSVSALPVARAAAWRAGAAVTAGTTPDSISGVRLQTRALPVRVNTGSTGKSLGSYAVTITWDSTVVRVDSVRPGDFGSPVVNYVNGGELRLTQVNTTGVTGDFSLAMLHFRFVNDTIGKRTVIQPAFTELTATDFSNLRADFATLATVARILAPTVAIGFSPDSLRERIRFKPGFDLTADLSGATGVSLGSYAAKVIWDSTIMRLDSIRSGDFTAPQTSSPNAGELRLTSADAQGLSSGPFNLVKLFFRFVNDTFPKQTSLALTVSEAHAAISFADLLPGIAAKSGKALIGGVLRGDIDVGGAVAALDAQLVLQSVVGLALPAGVVALPFGDADCSGALQARDAQIILNQVVGNPVSQFCVAKIQ